jgi:hypothetical protein
MSELKPIKICCSTVVKNILCEALRNYAFIELPKNTSTDKSQEKQNLLLAIKDFEKQFIDNQQSATLNKHIYSHCHAAIHFHYDRISNELNATVDEQRKLMFDVIKGFPALDAELDSAMQKDSI